MDSLLTVYVFHHRPGRLSLGDMAENLQKLTTPMPRGRGRLEPMQRKPVRIDPSVPMALLRPACSRVHPFVLPKRDLRFFARNMTCCDDVFFPGRKQGGKGQPSTGMDVAGRWWWWPTAQVCVLVLLALKRRPILGFLLST